MSAKDEHNGVHLKHGDLAPIHHGRWCYARTLRIVNNRLDYLLGVIESTFNDIKVAQLRLVQS